jgi:hypothetical protein
MVQDRQRADLGFGDALEDFDPEEWSPSTTPRVRPAAEATRQTAERLGFRSREAPVPDQEASTSGEKTGQRRRRTGRNAQFNLKARPETIAAYTAIADANGWGLGETLEHAVALLEKAYGKSNT